MIRAMVCDAMRPEDLARELGISGKELRAWLRKQFPHDAGDHGTNWHLTHTQVTMARRRFGATL